HGGRFDRRYVDRIDAGAEDGHGVQIGRVAGDEADVGRGTHVDRDRTRFFAVPADLVLAGRNLRETISAIGAYRDRTGKARRRIGQGDGVACDRGTVDRTSGVRLRVNTADEAHTKRDGKRAP